MLLSGESRFTGEIVLLKPKRGQSNRAFRFQNVTLRQGRRFDGVKIAQRSRSGRKWAFMNFRQTQAGNQAFGLGSALTHISEHSRTWA